MTNLLNPDTQDQVVANDLESRFTTSTIAFRLSNNLIVVEAAINGVRLSMILDTGAARTVVSRAAVQTLGLKESTESCAGTGAGGDVSMSSADIESLSIGSVSQHGFTSMTMDMSEICEKLGDDIDGIIGFDFLSQLRLTIDYPARQLVLEATRPA
jgi:predicted aspartyl protease